MIASASGSVCQQSATTRTSEMGRTKGGIGPEFRLRSGVVPGARSAANFGIKALLASRLAGYRPLRQSFIGGDDPCHQFMADHVFGGELHLGNPLDAVKQSRGFSQTGSLPVWQVD